jgi:hypothetical protein
MQKQTVLAALAAFACTAALAQAPGAAMARAAVAQRPHWLPHPRRVRAVACGCALVGGRAVVTWVGAKAVR